MEENKKVAISISIPKEMPLEKMRALGLALIKAAKEIVGEKDPDVYYKKLRYEVHVSLDDEEIFICYEEGFFNPRGNPVIHTELGG